LQPPPLPGSETAVSVYASTPTWLRSIRAKGALEPYARLGRGALQVGVRHALDDRAEVGDGERFDDVGGRPERECLRKRRQDAHADDRQAGPDLAQRACRLQMGADAGSSIRTFARVSSLSPRQM
jgi:hypothetical protein